MERTDRQLMSAVGPDREGAVFGIEAEIQVSRDEFGAVVVSEDRHEQFVAQVAPIRVPIDIEPTRVGGVRAPFENVEPERVVGAADAHVVRHEIKDLFQTLLAERFVETREGRRTSEGRVQQIVVRDVVSVRAARPRLEIGRSIEVADAEFRQVSHPLRRVVEAEVRRELKAVGGTRSHGMSSIEIGRKGRSDLEHVRRASSATMASASRRTQESLDHAARLLEVGQASSTRAEASPRLGRPMAYSRSRSGAFVSGIGAGCCVFSRSRTRDRD